MLDQIMHRNLVTLEPHAPVSEAARLMADRDVGCVVVLNANGKPRGIITDRDIVVRCIARNIDVWDTTVENIVSEELATCRVDDGIFDCIEKMREAGVRRMPVVDKKGHAVGIVSFGDLLAFLSREFYDLTRETTPEAPVSRAA